MKKSILVILSVLLLCSAMAATAQAPDLSVTVGTVTTAVGTETAELEVPIVLSGNTDLLGMTLDISYDPAITLKSVTKGTALPSMTMLPGGNLSSPFKITWDGTDADKTNGIVAILHFIAPIGQRTAYPISVGYRFGSVFSSTWRDLTLGTQNGGIVVGSLGDVNFDGAVNAADAILVLKHDAGITALSEKTILAGDLNADGVADCADAVLILQIDCGLR